MTAHEYREVTITPEVATQMLAVPTAPGKSRRVSMKQVSYIVGLMRAGLFRHNPADPIVVGSDGAVYNGRHRLTAVIEYGVPFVFTVLTGPDPDLFDVMDQVRRRSADQFVSGSEPQLQAAIARLTLWYASSDDYLNAHSRRVSMHEIIAEVDRLGFRLEEAARDVVRVYRGTGITKSVHGAVLVIGRQERHDPDMLALWVDGLSTGLDLSSTDPRWHLRERYRSNPPRALRDQWRVIVRAYNAFVHGESISRLIVKNDMGVLRVGATPGEMRRGGGVR